MFVFQCQCELPESYEAYRKQQHRWHSGPMQLFRLCLPDIIKSKVRLEKSSRFYFERFWILHFENDYPIIATSSCNDQLLIFE